MNPKIMERKEKNVKFTHTQLSEINKTAEVVVCFGYKQLGGPSAFCKFSRKNSRIRNRRSFFPSTHS